VKAQVLRRKRKLTSQVSDEKRLSEGKDRIADAAAALFLNGGYHSTSVREIAQRAGLSVGSVFNYFTSKEEILFFLFSRNQERTEATLQEQRKEFARLRAQGVDPQDLLWSAYEAYVRLMDDMRRYTVLGYQELKSLTATERRRILDGEERIQQFIEEVIAYGVEKGAFPGGDIDLKAHSLMMLAQSWAVRRWALKRFAKIDDYLSGLWPYVLAIVQSHGLHHSGITTMATADARRDGLPRERELLS